MKGDEHPTCTPHGVWHTLSLPYLFKGGSRRVTKGVRVI